eukprot:CAMPEP_0175808072 /NCGR_PEP_ID=MMETSP0107_2-20121207/2062_1 /TAXON_ID=195067 ORGANISM="Goniomonas pacifica, Strain CCMP1869" /NCGR_SAMPLE_ID=MMETSP0107_2 /ASSEMBLY_ACC=CAM_ASM_000203 /LENGTH=64 /DNA_ID=CAMNT_0017119671 /DNA_START=223 /DNA_END=417 /DNA_ORIENTATION=+
MSGSSMPRSSLGANRNMYFQVPGGTSAGGMSRAQSNERGPPRDRCSCVLNRGVSGSSQSPPQMR